MLWTLYWLGFWITFIFMTWSFFSTSPKLQELEEKNPKLKEMRQGDILVQAGTILLVSFLWFVAIAVELLDLAVRRRNQ